MRCLLTVVRNVEVYAPAAMGRRTLVIAAGRIIAIGEPATSVSRELVAEEVDLGGRRAIPVWIDGHVHVTGVGGEAGFASRVPAVAATTLALAGITTVVGVLGTDG